MLVKGGVPGVLISVHADRSPTGRGPEQRMVQGPAFLTLLTVLLLVRLTNLLILIGYL